MEEEGGGRVSWRVRRRQGGEGRGLTPRMLGYLERAGFLMPFLWAFCTRGRTVARTTGARGSARIPGSHRPPTRGTHTKLGNAPCSGCGSCGSSTWLFRRGAKSGEKGRVSDDSPAARGGSHLLPPAVRPTPSPPPRQGSASKRPFVHSCAIPPVRPPSRSTATPAGEVDPSAP